MQKFLLIALLCFNQICLAFLNQPSYETYSIEFVDDLPFINIKIEDQNAKVLIDTGARNQVLVLHEKIISQLTNIKKFPKKEKSSDITGREYIADKYIIPEFNLGSIKFLQLKLTQDTNWGMKAPSSVLDSKDGVIGLELFVNKAFILDYPNKKFIVIDRNIPNEYDVENWNDIDFKVDRYGLSLYLSIDYNKKKRFILDSGANISLIKKSATGITSIKDDCLFSLLDNQCKYIETRNIFSNGLELQNINFYIYDFPKDFEPDGIIGYNFLMDKAIYVDFEQRIFRMKIF